MRRLAPDTAASLSFADAWSPMNIRQQTIFRAVIKSGSITRAAQLLGLTQPAVTKALGLTEKALGLELFQRVKGRLVPTAHAQALIAQIDRVHDQFEEIDRLVADLRDGYAGQIAVAAIPSLAAAFLADAVSEFRRDRPNVRVEIQAVPAIEVMSRVLASQVDFGLLTDPPDAPYLDSEILCRGEAVCVMPADHALTAKDRIDMADFRDQPTISFRADTATGWQFRAALRQAGLADDVPLVVNQASTALRLVRAGAGLAVIDPFLLLDHNFTCLVARPISPSIPLTPHIIRGRERPRSRISASLIRRLREVVTRRMAATSF